MGKSLVLFVMGGISFNSLITQTVTSKVVKNKELQTRLG
jgi:hypothetical protein